MATGGVPITLQQMSAQPAKPFPAGGPPRCVRCGEVIGMYEPLIEAIGGVVRETSRAAEPQLAASAGIGLFHSACYHAQAASEEGPPHASL
jgi:hypothetical protein